MRFFPTFILKRASFNSNLGVRGEVDASIYGRLAFSHGMEGGASHFPWAHTEGSSPFLDWSCLKHDLVKMMY